MNQSNIKPLRCTARDRRPRALLLAASLVLGFALPAAAQAPAAPTNTAAPAAAEAMDALVGPIALYPDDLVAIILPASTSPLQIVQADRWLDKRKADPKLRHRRQVGRCRQDAAQLPRRGEDDEQRPRLDQRAGRGGGRRPGCRARRRAELPPPRAGGGQPEVRRQAGGQGREGNHHHRAGRSAGDLRAAVHPEHGGHLRRGTGLRLLPRTLSVVLLPLRTRSGTRCRRDLGRCHRCGLERRPLGRQLRRRRHQHRRRPQHQRQPQHQRRSQRGFAPAVRGRRQQHLEVQQAARPGQQFSGQVGAIGACRRRSRQRRCGRLRLGRRRQCPAVCPARRWRGRCGRAPLDPTRRCCRGWRCNPTLDPAFRRLRRQQRQPRRRRLRRLQLRAANADGQFARGVEPQLDVRWGCALRSQRWRCAWWRWRRAAVVETGSTNMQTSHLSNAGLPI